MNWINLPGDLRRRCIEMNEGFKTRHRRLMGDIIMELCEHLGKRCHVCVNTHGLDICLSPTMVAGKHGSIRTVFGSSVDERYSCINHFNILMIQAYQSMNVFVEGLVNESVN